MNRISALLRRVTGVSLVVQWLRICTAVQCRGVGSIPGQRIKILHGLEQLSPCIIITEPESHR